MVIIHLVLSVLLTICVIWGLLLRYVPFAPMLEGKKKRFILIFYTSACAVNFITLFVLMHFYGIAVAFNYLRYGVITFATVTVLINAVIIKGKIREHLFIYGIVLNCNYLLMSVPNYVISKITLQSTVQYLFAIIIMYFVLLLLAYFPLKNLLRFTISPFLFMDTGRYWNTIWFIPIAYFGAKYIALGGEHNSGSIGQLISSMLYAVIIVLMCMSIAADHKSMTEKLMMEKQLAEQKIHYTEMQATVENARHVRHDMKHHIEAIRRFIATDDMAGLSVYCDDLSRANDVDRTAIPYTGNTAIDGVVYRYIQLCEAKNTEFSYSGTVKNKGISDMDVCVLVGNALDNAYNACLTIPENRFIKLICKSEPQLLTIIVQNSFDGKIEQKDGDVLISRKRGDRPGVGMASMETVCKRLDGTMDKSWDDGVFNLMIMLPIKETE